MTPQSLREWRERQQFTQPQAAAFFRVGLRTYKAWELGETAIPGPVGLVIDIIDQTTYLLACLHSDIDHAALVDGEPYTSSEVQSRLDEIESSWKTSTPQKR